MWMMSQSGHQGFRNWLNFNLKLECTSSVCNSSLPMAHSLAAECTPLKLKYDSCFNAWFEGYLQPAVSASANPAEREQYRKSKAEEYEQNCGKLWEEYKSCVQVRSLIISIFS